MAFLVILVLSCVLWIGFPLFHCGDFIAFYKRGIVYCKRKWTLEELGEISFLDVRTNYSFFTRTYMRTAVRDFNLTYIKDGKKNYNRAYFEAL